MSNAIITISMDSDLDNYEFSEYGELPIEDTLNDYLLGIINSLMGVDIRRLVTQINNEVTVTGTFDSLVDVISFDFNYTDEDQSDIEVEVDYNTLNSSVQEYIYEYISSGELDYHAYIPDYPYDDQQPDDPNHPDYYDWMDYDDWVEQHFEEAYEQAYNNEIDDFDNSNIEWREVLRDCRDDSIFEITYNVSLKDLLKRFFISIGSIGYQELSQIDTILDKLLVNDKISGNYFTYLDNDIDLIVGSNQVKNSDYASYDENTIIESEVLKESVYDGRTVINFFRDILEADITIDMNVDLKPSIIVNSKRLRRSLDELSNSLKSIEKGIKDKFNSRSKHEFDSLNVRWVTASGENTFHFNNYLKLDDINNTSDQDIVSYKDKCIIFRSEKIELKYEDGNLLIGDRIKIPRGFINHRFLELGIESVIFENVSYDSTYNRAELIGRNGIVSTVFSSPNYSNTNKIKYISNALRSYFPNIFEEMNLKQDSTFHDFIEASIHLYKKETNNDILFPYKEVPVLLNSLITLKNVKEINKPSFLKIKNSNVRFKESLFNDMFCSVIFDMYLPTVNKVIIDSGYLHANTRGNILVNDLEIKGKSVVRDVMIPYKEEVNLNELVEVNNIYVIDSDIKRILSSGIKKFTILDIHNYFKDVEIIELRSSEYSMSISNLLRCERDEYDRDRTIYVNHSGIDDILEKTKDVESFVIYYEEELKEVCRDNIDCLKNALKNVIPEGVKLKSKELDNMPNKRNKEIYKPNDDLTRIDLDLEYTPSRLQKSLEIAIGSKKTLNYKNINIMSNETLLTGKNAYNRNINLFTSYYIYNVICRVVDRGTEHYNYTTEDMCLSLVLGLLDFKDLNEAISSDKGFSVLRQLASDSYVGNAYSSRVVSNLKNFGHLYCIVEYIKSILDTYFDPLALALSHKNYLNRPNPSGLEVSAPYTTYYKPKFFEKYFQESLDAFKFFCNIDLPVDAHMKPDDIIRKILDLDGLNLSECGNEESNKNFENVYNDYYSFKDSENRIESIENDDVKKILSWYIASLKLIRGNEPNTFPSIPNIQDTKNINGSQLLVGTLELSEVSKFENMLYNLYKELVKIYNDEPVINTIFGENSSPEDVTFSLIANGKEESGYNYLIDIASIIENPFYDNKEVKKIIENRPVSRRLPTLDEDGNEIEIDGEKIYNEPVRIPYIYNSKDNPIDYGVIRSLLEVGKLEKVSLRSGDRYREAIPLHIYREILATLSRNYQSWMKRFEKEIGSIVCKSKDDSSVKTLANNVFLDNNGNRIKADERKDILRELGKTHNICIGNTGNRYQQANSKDKCDVITITIDGFISAFIYLDKGVLSEVKGSYNTLVGSSSSKRVKAYGFSISTHLGLRANIEQVLDAVSIDNLLIILQVIIMNGLERLIRPFSDGRRQYRQDTVPLLFVSALLDVPEIVRSMEIVKEDYTKERLISESIDELCKVYSISEEECISTLMDINNKYDILNKSRVMGSIKLVNKFSSDKWMKK
jgi:hypothetical protein